MGLGLQCGEHYRPEGGLVIGESRLGRRPQPGHGWVHQYSAFEVVGTRYEVLDVLVGAISSTAVLVTVLYLSWQTRAAREQAAVLSAQVVSERFIGLDRAFLDHPELRPYFYDGQSVDALDSATRNRVAALAELTLDVFQLALTGGGAYAVHNEARIRTWIVRGFARSPALRHHLHADRALYGDELLALLQVAESRRGTPG